MGRRGCERGKRGGRPLSPPPVLPFLLRLARLLLQSTPAAPAEKTFFYDYGHEEDDEEGKNYSEYLEKHGGLSLLPVTALPWRGTGW